MRKLSTQQRDIKLYRGAAPRPAWVREFAKRLRNALKADDRSGAELARYAGCREATVSHASSGKSQPSLRLFRSFCLLHGHSADAMLGLDQCPECGRTVEQEKAKSHCRRRAA